MLPGPTWAGVGVEDEEIGPGYESPVHEFMCGGQTCLPGADDDNGNPAGQVAGNPGGWLCHDDEGSSATE